MISRRPGLVNTPYPVAALFPATLYTSRLSARSALFTEFHILVNGWHELLSSAAYRSLVVRDNVLGRSSTSARSKIWEELKKRYRLDAADPLFSAFWHEWRRGQSEPEKALTAYVLFALNDRLVFDLGVQFLFPLLNRANAELRVGDVHAFIERAKTSHPEVRGWSAKTQTAVAQKYLASVRDFGLARGTVRKTAVRPALYGAPVRLIARALRLNGAAAVDVVSAEAFKLLALDRSHVVNALSDLNATGALRFRMQGDVVELDVEGR